MTFLLPRKCPDWNRLEQCGFNLSDIYNMSEVKRLMDEATFILFSKKLNPRFEMYDGYRDKTIFMQHGTISDISDCMWYIRGRIARFAKYILCSAEWEKNIISNGCHTIVPVDTGLPRHDFLLRRHK